MLTDADAAALNAYTSTVQFRSADWKVPVFEEVDDLADMRERKARRAFLRSVHGGDRGERYRAARALWLASLGLPDPLALDGGKL